MTLEGFCEDPPGYVDKIVWPNYVNDHKFLFEEQDVHRPLDEKVCNDLRIHGMPENGQEDMSKCLQWAVGVMEKEVRDASLAKDL